MFEITYLSRSTKIIAIILKNRRVGIAHPIGDIDVFLSQLNV
jgi:hypothetical protein